MDPISGNSLSNTCPDPTGSNCVIWQGPAVDGVCKGSSITDVVMRVNDKATLSAQCCTGDFPDGHSSLYTGLWIDFSPSIPLTGTGVGCSYSITGFGSTSGFNNPQYKWLQNGDIEVRGGFNITVTPTMSKGTCAIIMAAIPVIGFPTGWTASQFGITAADPLSSTPQDLDTILTGGVYLEYPSGLLKFGFSFVATKLSLITSTISLGALKFNIA